MPPRPGRACAKPSKKKIAEARHCHNASGACVHIPCRQGHKRKTWWEAHKAGKKMRPADEEEDDEEDNVGVPDRDPEPKDKDGDGRGDGDGDGRGDGGAAGSGGWKGIIPAGVPAV